MYIFPLTHNHISKIKYLLGVLLSDSSSEEDSSAEEEDSELEHEWGELDADAETTEESTKR